MYCIIGVNVLVFLSWRIPSLARFNHKYFLSFPKKGIFFEPMLATCCENF